METSWEPIVAGVLNIIVGVATLFGTFIAVTVLVGIGGGLLSISRIIDLMPTWLSAFIEGGMVIIAILLILFSALPLIGGIFAVQRKNWIWALIGSIVAIFSSTILGITSTVLVSLSKNEFEINNRFR